MKLILSLTFSAPNPCEAKVKSYIKRFKAKTGGGYCRIPTRDAI